MKAVPTITHIPAEQDLRASYLVTPSMCGHNSLLIGRIGDWTWQLVGEACDVDVLRARTADGQPTYLSFCYYRVVGSRRFHLRTPGFGDRLSVRSQVYSLGSSQSVVTLHEVRRTESAAGPLTATEFFRFPDPDCLYVEHYNRWVSRTATESNRDLVRASPVSSRHDRLPTLDLELSPRLPFRRGLTTGTPRAEPLAAADSLRLTFPVDITRDLNGAGLLYFASYFSLVDRAVLAWWRHQGRSTASFLARITLDQQLCLIGNADADTMLSVDVSGVGAGGVNRLDVRITEEHSGRMIAVCALDIVLEEQ